MSILSTAEIQQDLATIGAALRDVTVVVRGGHPRRSRSPDAQGSGIVWEPGLVVTNAHVATETTLSVELPDRAAVPATLVARDPRRDLAVLRVDPGELGARHTATIGDPDRLRPGELVVALGHPLGVPHSLALGVVHTVGKASWQGERATTPALIHTDIRLAPGNSGGPLADVRGRVLGVNAMIAGGLGVAISATEVRHLLLAAEPRPRLGATLREVTVRVGARGERDERLGLLVMETSAGGTAARAGLVQGDVLLGHAGRPFRSPDDLLALLHDAGPGGTLRLDVGRGGARLSLEVTLGAAVGAERRAA
ncbi:PDZ/DHR/GLGF domain protein [Gemmatirosa kalamazoonensis]|uniref:PDZ/DHR/GLGF domain protein n=1 Tax=Gemmatirosa kalamazoonensis TaxID=861299 RepID=W0REX2_9BACT|nr:trypsin-like peptidase domain-containing protein [Gemmatirosa kalamazoonensis]AHG88992.1 PDZ/DHR/GLGF domain protein [Gemmatirosa kalamazoonensis]